MNLLDYTGPTFMLSGNRRHKLRLDIWPIPFLSKLIYGPEGQVWMLHRTNEIKLIRTAWMVVQFTLSCIIATRAGRTLTAWSIRCNPAAKSSALESRGMGFERKGMSWSHTDWSSSLYDKFPLSDHKPTHVFHIAPIICYKVCCRYDNA